MWEYTDKVREHFTNPKNVGEVENPDATGEAGSLACGDALKLTLKLDDTGHIADARFKTFGCASAIASSSALTEMIKGKTLEEASHITNRQIADYLGGLPPEKMHCSVMGEEALQSAIRNYQGLDPLPSAEGTIICQCFGVTDKEIEKVALANNLHTVEEITNYTKAGGACGNCLDDIAQVLAKVWAGEQTHNEPAPAPRMTIIQKLKLVEETLEREVRPLLKADGGDIELIDINGNVVKVALRGTCSSCQASQTTINHLVQSKLREFVTPDIIVEEA